MNIKEKSFKCRRCGIEFRRKAKKCYYCDTCVKKVNSERVMLRRSIEQPWVKMGVGSGGNQYGANNHRYKDGRSHYKDVFNRENPDVSECEICGSQRYLVVHHIDKNRKNNARENLVKVCRSCHSKIHGLQENFKKTNE